LVAGLRAHVEHLRSTGVDGIPRAAAAPATTVEARPAAGGAPTGETLDALRLHIGDCQRCKLAPGRTHLVFGVGNPEADLMFVGEGPGRDEDLQGEPFVGRAGKLLTRIIEAMGFAREDVYIANAVKCRPPKNRDPAADEIGACRHFLMRQVAIIKPEIVVLLGNSAVRAVLDREQPMSRMRGRFLDWNGVRVMCTYHPAYLLRNPSAKKMVWEDMKIVRDALAAAAPE
jgi:DNA polymerase